MPKMPKVKEAPPAPDRTSGQVAAAAEEQRKRYAGSSSFASSMLTGGTGAATGSGVVNRLLGGGV